jgi:chromosome segregation ATPase
MKFFTALLALFTPAAAPKTLDQARTTFAEAKAALDRIGRLFTAASLDLDALLEKGDDALKDFIADLNRKAADADSKARELEGRATAAEQKATQAESDISALRTQHSALSGLLAAIGFKVEADSKPEAVQAAFNAHVSGSVTQKLQELGQPAGNLPSPNSTGTAEETEAELTAQLNETKDPVIRGQIAAKLNAIRDKRWGKN